MTYRGYRMSLALLLAAPAWLAAQQPGRKAGGDTTPPPSAPPPSAVPLNVTEPRVDTVDRVVAVVGNTALTWSDLATAVNQQRALGLQLPSDPKEQQALARQILNGLVDEELLVQKAHAMNVEVSDQDVATEVDKQIKDVRSHFKTDAEYRQGLKESGFGSPEEYHRFLTDQIRRHQVQQKVFAELRKGAKPGNVTETEVDSALVKMRPQLEKQPALVTFRQIVVAPRPSREADARAKAKADSLLALLKHGADFAAMAKRESADSGSADSGGSLGWQRRGSGLVPEFEAMMFAIPPGQLSPVFKTAFGYHIIRVDRVRPAEVLVRHILIAPVIDSNDAHRAFVRADSVAQLWRKGANFDTLVARYHDPAEEKGILEPYPVDSLPPAYQTAVTPLKANEVSQPFSLTSSRGTVKYAVLQVLTHTNAGEYSLPDVRQRLREELAAERQARDILDGLRKQTYVAVRL